MIGVVFVSKQSRYIEYPNGQVTHWDVLGESAYAESTDCESSTSGRYSFAVLGWVLNPIGFPDSG